jgi:hypothetical protein
MDFEGIAINWEASLVIITLPSNQPPGLPK